MSRPVPNQLPSTDPGPVRLALIGEAPGADEVAQGYPFAGRSGWALNQWLASAGISRSQCFVGNVVQVRPSPTSNDFHLFEWNESRVQEGIAALREDLARFRPNLVVGLGNAALHLLRQGNVAPGKSAKLGLFQWVSHVGTWRGSLFRAAASFDAFEAADLRVRSGRCPAVAADALFAGDGQRNQSLAQDETVRAAQLAPARAGAPTTAPSLAGGSPATGTPFPAPPHSNAAAATSTSPPTPPLPPQPGGINELRAGLDAHPVQACAPTAGGSPCAFASPPPFLDPRSSGLSGSCANIPPTELRGSSTFKALATYHPAATFREPSFVFPLVSDLKRAVAESRTPDLVLPERRIRWGLSIDELESECEEIRKRRAPVGHDIEGGLGGLHCCSFAITPADAFVVDLMALHGDGPRTYAAIASVLEDENVPKVLWNAAYERAIWEAVASVTIRNYEDGMIAFWERFSELPKGLDFVASILTREPYWAEGIGWDKKTGMPRVLGAPFWTYNALDSLVTLEIWQSKLIREVVESRTPVAFTV